jgi:hypothetical protein
VPRMANATSPLIEQRVVAFALGHPGFGAGPHRRRAGQATRGEISLSPNGVWRVLGRHGLSTRARRYGLVAGSAAPPALSGPSHDPSGTWTWSTLGSWSSWTACASGA